MNAKHGSYPFLSAMFFCLVAKQNDKQKNCGLFFKASLVKLLRLCLRLQCVYQPPQREKIAKKHIKNKTIFLTSFFSMQNSKETLVKYSLSQNFKKGCLPMLNPTPKIQAFLILLVCGALFLPACGKKNEVKSQAVPETVLKAAITPVATVTSQSSVGNSTPAEKVEAAVNADDEEQMDPTDSSADSETMDEVPMTKAASAPKPRKKAEPVAAKSITETAAAGNAAVSAASTPEAMAPVPAEDSSMENVQVPAKKKNGLMNALLWMILIPVLLIGLIWFIWSMFHKRELPFQPAPPMGGLSPVSGFTAMKNQIQAESESKVSFWNKKLF
jgi:hypothetical protein